MRNQGIVPFERRIWGVADDGDGRVRGGREGGMDYGVESEE